MEVRVFHLPPMGKLSNNQEKDYKKYFLEKGEDGFNPLRNKAIVEDTIALYERERARRKKAFVEQVDERADAVASFLGAVNRGKDGNLMHYFGKRELARLRGVEIMEEIMQNLTVKSKTGKKVTRPMRAEQLMRQ